MQNLAILFGQLGMCAVSVKAPHHLHHVERGEVFIFTLDWAFVGFKATTKISNEFYLRGLTIINFLRIFGTRGIKT